MKWQELKDNPRIKFCYEMKNSINRLIREFFWSQNFIETDTPIAVKLPGQEPYLDPIKIIIHNSTKQSYKLYLQTSPEYAMKKLLGAGYKKIFQICKCFRDFENFGGYHNVEFSMLEWYRSPSNLEEVIDDTENLVKYIANKTKIKKFKRKNKTINILEKWDRFSMKEIWEKYLKINLDDYLTLENIKKLAQKIDCDLSEEGLYEDYFYKIFLNKIEKKLGLERPVFIYDYPAQLCSLSCLVAENKNYAKRFELYIDGVELANAFGELVDGVEQKKRLEKDRNLRKKFNKDVWDIDGELIKALDTNLVSAAGIALGIDRLAMFFCEAFNINEVLFQSTEDLVNN